MANRNEVGCLVSEKQEDLILMTPKFRWPLSQCFPPTGLLLSWTNLLRFVGSQKFVQVIVSREDI